MQPAAVPGLAAVVAWDRVSANNASAAPSLALFARSLHGSTLRTSESLPPISLSDLQGG